MMIEEYETWRKRKGLKDTARSRDDYQKEITDIRIKWAGWHKTKEKVNADERSKTGPDFVGGTSE